MKKGRRKGNGLKKITALMLVLVLCIPNLINTSAILASSDAFTDGGGSFGDGDSTVGSMTETTTSETDAVPPSEPETAEDDDDIIMADFVIEGLPASIPMEAAAEANAEAEFTGDISTEEPTEATEGSEETAESQDVEVSADVISEETEEEPDGTEAAEATDAEEQQDETTAEEETPEEETPEEEISDEDELVEFESGESSEADVMESGEPVIRIYSDEEVEITATAEPGAVPEDVQLRVIPIKEEDLETEVQYMEVSEKLEEDAAEKEQNLLGFLAYDIAFVREVDGVLTEVEPTGEVSVNINYLSATTPVSEETISQIAENEGIAPEEVQPDVSVIHFEEQEDGQVQLVDLTAEEETTVETTENQEVSEVELKTKSFSIYTITWYYIGFLSNYSDKMTMYHGYMNGDSFIRFDFDTDTGTDDEYDTGSKDISDFAKDYSGYGYNFSKAYLGTSDGINETEVKRLHLTNTSTGWYRDYQIQYSTSDTGDDWQTLGDKSIIYMVYVPVATPTPTQPPVASGLKITFDANGGNGTAPDPITGLEENQRVQLPNYSGTNGDKAFVGWSAVNNANAARQYTNPVYPVNSYYTMGNTDVILYATWADTNVDAAFYIRIDGTIPTEPQGHAGSEYTGTAPQEAISGRSVAVGTNSGTGLTDYSLIGAIKTGTFYTNSTVGVGSQLNKEPTAEEILAALNKDHNNYNPATYYISDGKIYRQTGDSQDVTNDPEVYVLWYVIKNESWWHVDGVLLERNKVNLSYDANAPAGEWGGMPDGSQYAPGTNAIVGANGYAPDGTSEPDIKTPVRTGYTFAGWNTKADGSGTSYTNEGLIMMDQNYTLYAQWTPIHQGEVITSKELSHEKYIKYNGDDSYDLTLNVSGAVGTETNKAKIDVIFVMDTSNSMKWAMNYKGNQESAYLTNYQTDSSSRFYNQDKAVKDAVSAISAKDTVDARYSVVQFDTTASILQQWTSDTSLSYPTKVAYGTGGTNYVAGLNMAKTLLASARSGASKIVVFLSDGDVTYYYDSKGNLRGNGSSYSEDGMKEAQNVLATMSMNYFYTVGVGPSTSYEHLSNLINNAPSGTVTGSYNGTDAANLKNAFASIIGSVVDLLCTGVTIKDTLTDEVDIIENTVFTVTARNGDQVYSGETGVISLTKKTEQSVALTDGSGKSFVTVTVSYDPSTKQVVLAFPVNYQLVADYTYDITMKIKPTNLAYQEFYAGGYPDTGDAGTDAPDNTTSSGQPGFNSNSSATVDYTYNGSSHQEVYKDPVVQVHPETVSAVVNKNWQDASGDALTPAEGTTVEVSLKATVNETELTAGTNGLPASMAATLSANNSWTNTWSNLPKYYYYVDNNIVQKAEVSYSVDETVVPTGYKKVVSVSNGVTTITNRQCEISVTKSWSDGDTSHSNDTVYVGLYKWDEEGSTWVRVEGQYKVLTDGTSATFTGFDTSGKYTVKELKTATDSDYDFAVGSDPVLYLKGVENSALTTVGDSDYRVTYTAADDKAPESGTVELTFTDDVYAQSMKIANTKIAKIAVSKTWSVPDSIQGTASHPSVLAGLYKVGDDAETLLDGAVENTKAVEELNAANNWTAEFDVVIEEGTLSDYVVREVVQSGDSYVSVADNGYVLVKGDVIKDGVTKDNVYQVTYTQAAAANDNGVHAYALTNTLVLGKLTINKTDANDNPLAGAQFELTSKEDSSRKYTSAETTADGVVVIENIIPGEYSLTEIKTPAGYSLLANSVDVTIPVTDGTSDSGITNVVNAGSNAKYYFEQTLTIKNNELFDMPQGGGSGTKTMTFAGIFFIIAAAGITLFFRRRRIY